jgi:hypothetical protein
MVMTKYPEADWKLVAMGAVLEATSAEKSTIYEEIVGKTTLVEAKSTSHKKVIQRTALDKAIHSEYPDVFQEPKGLPPWRPNLGMGDFKMCLISRAKLPYRAPYRMTLDEKQAYFKQVSKFEEMV